MQHNARGYTGVVLTSPFTEELFHEQIINGHVDYMLVPRDWPSEDDKEDINRLW